MSQHFFEQARGLLQAGRPADAETLLRQIAGPGAPFAVHYLLALACYQQNRGEAALAAIDQALRRDPGSAEALKLKAVLLLSAGRAAEALDVFDRLLAARPAPDLWYNRGVALAGLGRFEDAVTSFDKALALAPSPEGWNERGAALNAMDRAQEALAAFDRALALNPDFAMARYNRACALLQLGRFGESLGECDAVLARNGNFADAWNNRGAALQGLGHHGDALASYERAAALAPGSPRAWHNRAMLLQKLGRAEEALQAYDQVLARSPLHVEAMERRAVVLIALGRFEEALAVRQRLVELNPDDAENWLALGALLAAVQRFDEALVCSDRTLALWPDHPAGLHNRGSLLCETGRIGEGIALYRRLAEQTGGGGKNDTETAHKQRHDQEQAAYLAAAGIASSEFHIAGGERLSGPAINLKDAAAVTAAWRQSDPALVVVDDLLTPQALVGLRRFCWGSTIWRKAYRFGYLGAMPEHGFACPLLAQIAEELAAGFPAIFAGHGLNMLWGFKYDSAREGIHIHADQAAVNVNFWITPDEANLNPENGGLVVWDKAAPLDWDIRKYNGDDDAVRAFLAQAGAKPVTVPYRANRAVIFDSNLFHETDRIEFAQGYLNRRINITMLYGRRTFYGR